MTPDHHARGGAAVASLKSMRPSEARIVRNLRLWCEGPDGQAQVWIHYRTSFPGPRARVECKAFEMLLQIVISTAHRPLVRHEVACTCVGSDECIFLHLVNTAGHGHLRDAALIATLLVGPQYAEHVAGLAAQVGKGALSFDEDTPHLSTNTTGNVVRLH
ncbi:MAG: hypothetical protein AAGK92_10910 [Pseudomonadota bacterium]